MSRAPRVSVVVPAYNAETFLRQTLESIADQGVAELEILVIDDGSTDGTARVAEAFGAPVRLIRQANAGVCVGRNRGIAEARGRYIALVDHDDIWLPHKLGKQLSVLDQRPEIDVVYTDFVWWHPDPATGRFPEPATYPATPELPPLDPDFSGWIYHQMLTDSHVLTSTALARAGLVKDSGGFDEGLPFSEDWDFWLRLSRVARFAKLKEASTLYRQHPTQGSRMTRPIDYRTRLLSRARDAWGLCSPDGRCLDARRFQRQLAVYATSFGLQHLSGHAGASRVLAARSFLDAFRIDPRYWKSLAYLAATPLGWRPKW